MLDHGQNRPGPGDGIPAPLYNNNRSLKVPMNSFPGRFPRKATMTRPGLSLLVPLFLVQASSSCAPSRHSAPEKGSRPESESVEAAVKAGMERCPVCGTLLNRGEAQAFVHQGKTYFFCPNSGDRMERSQPSCLDEFKKNPSRFTQKRTP